MTPQKIKKSIKSLQINQRFLEGRISDLDDQLFEAKRKPNYFKIVASAEATRIVAILCLVAMTVKYLFS